LKSIKKVKGRRLNRSVQSHRRSRSRFSWIKNFISS
jgi:hypothetical protein